MLRKLIPFLKIRMDFHWFSGSIVNIVRKKYKWQRWWRQRRRGQCSCRFVPGVYICFWQFDKHRWV